MGWALAVMLRSREGEDRDVLIGMDTRISSPKIRDALSEGIISGGMNAVCVGVCSTPAVSYLVKKHKYSAGVMISASHNPFYYNGIKIFGPDGYKICDEWEEKIEETVEKERMFSANTRGDLKTSKTAINEYISHLVACFGVSLYGLRIGIDCANGSCSVSATRVFEGLGAECTVIADKPDGMNINDNCGSTNPNRLKELVIKERLDFGVAFDGDGDRCIAIDEGGREIDGDFILAILGLWFKSEGRLRGNTIVGTVMSNLGLAKFCEENDIDFVSERVGDRFVLERMIDGGFALGGEQSGHVILLDHALTGDGQLSAIALSSYIKKNGKSLSTLARVMKKYPQYLTSITADDDDKQSFKSDEVIQCIIHLGEEGLRGNGRLLIRPSGTEPLIRIMAEGESIEELKKICEDTANAIKKRLCELKTAVRE